MVMKQYQLRFLDRLNVAVLTRVYAGPDDLGALAEAERLSSTHTIEVWDGPRRVVRVKKRKLAATPTDRIAGESSVA
jgi:hypothetical protein